MMKLSTLMHEGAAVTCGMTDNYVATDLHVPGDVCACAIGAVYVGAVLAHCPDATPYAVAVSLRAAAYDEEQEWSNLSWGERLMLIPEGFDCAEAACAELFDVEFGLMRRVPVALAEAVRGQADSAVRIEGDVASLVVALNDDAGWSRERIADLLAEHGF